MGAILAGRYELLESLGRGGMCEVHRARQLSVGRIVALKLLRPELAASPDDRLRFEREAQYAAQLFHPGIVQVIEFVEGEPPGIAMELVDGPSLRQALRRGLPAPRALELLAQVADALSAAHQAGILHRDLKPENVLITPDGRAKVGDWGLSRPVDDQSGLTRTGVILGTPTYMAPEVITEGRSVPASDLYALGCMLHEVLAGAPPFDRVDVTGTLTAHLKEPAPALRSVPPLLSRLVADLLIKDPASRPSDAAEVAARLREALQAGPPAPAGATTLQVRPAALRATQAAAAAVARDAGAARRLVASGLAFVAAGLLLGWGLASRRPTPPPALEPRAAVALLEAPLQPRLDRLVFRAHAPGPGRFHVTVIARGSRRTLLVAELDLSTSRRASSSFLTAERQLSEPLLEPFDVVTRVTDATATFHLDPFQNLPSRVEEVLGPLDQLHDKALRLLLTDAAESVRRARSAAAPSERGYELLAEDLERQGITRTHQATLRAALPHLFGPRDTAASPTARRLYPLRALEAHLSTEHWPRYPWGPSVSGLLGVTFITRERLPSLESSWLRLASVATQREVPSTDGDRPRRQYYWCASPEMQEHMRKAGAFAFIGGGVLGPKGEDLPDLTQVPGSVDVDLEVRAPPGRPWPPAEARVNLIARGRFRHASLVLRFNGGPELELFDSAALMVEHVSASARIDPSWVREGRNVLRVTPRTLPAPNAEMIPVALKHVGLDARW